MTTAALRPARVPGVASVRLGLGGLGRTVLAAADGLVIGLVLAYVGLTAIGAPASYLGIPDPLAVIVVGGATAAATAVLAGLAVLIRRLVVAATHRLTARRAIAGRPRLAGLLAVPARILGALPVGWLAAFGGLLWLALVGRTAVPPLALATPPSSTIPFLYLLGIVGAVLAVARTAVRPSPESGAVPSGWRRAAGTALTILAAVIVIAAASVAWWPGRPVGPVASAAALAGPLVATTLDDPGLAGPYAVEHLSYGTGDDARRPAFGTEADLRTTPVDASALLEPLGPGAEAARRWFWGFGEDAVPVQGLASLPVGAGPFPLVLIVHGNHAMGDFSEAGYTYLADHLASRGFIAVSVDEDALNGSWAGDYLGDEQVVRAWLLLLHLDQWRSWSAPDGPLAGRVDLERVALIGHSRGGEAAAVAAALAGVDHAPRGGMTPWPIGLDVDAVVAIAPSDGQYTGSLRLDGVDFLTLQGGWDADARAYSGIRQYARTTPDRDGFAAGLWVYRANHGQSSTVWGRADFGPFSPAVLDLASLLTPAEQQDVARTAIGAFLEASLHHRTDYRGLFRRPMVGREWLPEDVVIVRSRTGDAMALTTGTPDRPTGGVTVTTTGATAVTLPIPLRALQPDQAMRGTRIAWTPGSGAAVWRLDGLPAVATAPSAIRIAVADGRSVDASDGVPLPVAVRVTSDGASAVLPLDRFGAVPPPLPVHLVKHDLLAATAGLDLAVRSTSEVVLQTYELPLAAFVEATPELDPAAPTSLAIEVERTSDGALWIAEPVLVP